MYMDRKNLIQNFKETLKSLLKFSPANPAVGKLDSGTEIWVNSGESLEVGSEVMILDEASEGLIPLQDGDYNLEDGTPFKVVEGKVSEMGKEAEDEVEVETEEAMEEGTDQVTSPDSEKIAALETKVAELEGLINGILETMSGVVEASSKLKKQVEKYLKEPAEEGIKMSKSVKVPEKEIKDNIKADELLDKVLKLSFNKVTQDFS